MSVYLPNVYRTAFGGLDSVVDDAVAKKAAEAYVAKTGKSVYIPGLGTISGGGSGDPPKTTIGTVTGSGDGLADDALALNVGNQTDITAAFSGDATDVSFKWTIRSGVAVSIVGNSTNRTVKLEGAEAGMATIRCTLTSAKSSDSPADLTIGAVVEA